MQNQTRALRQSQSRSDVLSLFVLVSLVALLMGIESNASLSPRNASTSVSQQQ